MIKEDEQFERSARAARLQQARKSAGFGGVKSASGKFKWNVNNYKAHESGRNGFGLVDAKKYAKAYKVSLQWLYFGIGAPEDVDIDPVVAVDVPLISWVSAGMLSEQQPVTDFGDFQTIPALDLPDGEWIALRVVGDSMNKISPPESIIFVNRRDKRLVHNACYVVTDEAGNTTYKRYRSDEYPPFQPASYKSIDAPTFEGAINVIGRVRRSVIDM